MPELDATIGIVTWRSRELLRGCLNSLNSCAGEVNAEVIVVDNGSHDGSVEMIQKHYPHVRLIQNPTNEGVAPARNRILNAAWGRYVIVLDVDTLVLPGALARLVETMDVHPEAAVGGPKLVYRDGRLQLSCRPFPSPLNILIEGTFLRDYFPHSRYVKDYTMEEWDHHDLREVDWVYGACLILRKTALDRLGLFDEGYFYLYEDVDLCLRAKHLGMKVLYIPQAVVVHFLERERRSVLSRTLPTHLRSITRYLWKRYVSLRGDYATL